MAILSALSCREFYRYDLDEYHFPNGSIVDGGHVRRLDRKAKDDRDAARAYNPYNHNGLIG